MYEYKKIGFHFTGSNLNAKRVEESLDDMFEIIRENAKEGWRFVQAVHPFPTNTACLLLFEREA